MLISDGNVEPSRPARQSSMASDWPQPGRLFRYVHLAHRVTWHCLCPVTCQSIESCILMLLLFCAGICLYYTALQLLPLADVVVFGFLIPLIVALLSPLLVKEQPSWCVSVAATHH